MTWLFIFATIGLTRIMISSEIMEPIDEFAKHWMPQIAYHALFECYQCCGFWSGVFLGATLLSDSPFVIFGAGCAGSYLSDFAQSLFVTMEKYQDDA